MGITRGRDGHAIAEPAGPAVSLKRPQQLQRAQAAQGEEKAIDADFLGEPDQVGLEHTHGQGQSTDRSTEGDPAKRKEERQAEQHPPGREKTQREIPVPSQGYPSFEQEEIKGRAHFLSKGHGAFEQHPQGQPGDPERCSFIQPDAMVG